MSKFKALLIGGIAVGVLTGGLVGLFSSGKNQPASTSTSSPPKAGTPSEQAARLDDQGKTLMFAGKFGEASALFRDAVRLVPEPKYLFDLGMSLFQEGKFDEAISVLEKVRVNNPTDDQLGRTGKLIVRIYDECKAQRIACVGMKASANQP